MAYGDWMNGLQGMTTALGAASPYAQQLAQNNAQQVALAQMIRSGAFGGYGGGYPIQPVPTYGGGTPMTPQPYSAPTPFTEFADVLKPKTAPAPTILPIGDPSPTRRAYVPEDIETNEVTGGLPAPEGKGYDNFRDWWDAMKGLPGFVAQFTPPGIAKSVYNSGGFDPVLRAVGLNNLSASEGIINEYSSPEGNFGSKGATYNPVSPEVMGRPDWWNAESLRVPTGNASQQAIRDLANRINAAAEAEQYGILPGLTGNVPPASTSPNAPIPMVQYEPLPPPEETLGLLSDAQTQRDEIIQQSKDENDWRNDGWWQDEDSGTWYRD